MTIDEVMETIDDFCAADRAGCGVCEGICECREQDREDLRAAIQAYGDERVREEREACAKECEAAEADIDSVSFAGDCSRRTARTCAARIRARGVDSLRLLENVVNAIRARGREVKS